MRNFLRLYFGTPQFEALPLFSEDSLVSQYFSAKHLKEALRGVPGPSAGQAYDTVSYFISCPAEDAIAAQMHALNALNEMPPRLKRRIMRDYLRRVQQPRPTVAQTVAAE